jgi:ABC-type transport system involved in multi-copper enzyme maturation permease subunit
MLQRVFILALNTFRESIRNKILYSVIIFAVLVCAAASAFGRVTIGDQALVVVNFGLFCTSLFSVAYALISGSSLVAKELAKRTIFTLLARPVARYEILIGKWLGLLVTASTLVVLMIAALAIYAQSVFGFSALLLFEAGFFIILELIIVCSLIILFSSLVVTPLFIGVFSLALFLAGRNSSSILQMIEQSAQGTLSESLLRLCYTLLPKFELLTMSDRLVAGELIGINQYYYGFCYTLGYSIITLVIASAIFKRREFN